MGITVHKEAQSIGAARNLEFSGGTIGNCCVEPLKKTTCDPATYAGSEMEMQIRAEERNRIARELHHSTAKLLETLDAQLNRLKEVPSSTTDDAFVEILGEFGAVLAELQDGVSTLSEPHLCDGENLVASLQSMAAAFSLETGVRISTDLTDPSPGLPPSTALAFFRVSQEALANACRHGNARQISLVLLADGQSMVLRVTDDGLGLGPPALGSCAGRGILNMTARMEELGGTLTIRNGEFGAVLEAKAPIGRRRDVPLMLAVGQQV